MYKRVFLVLAVALVATALIAGGDPWKDKPYKQWDASDVQKVLFDSPWARPVSVASTWRPASGGAITSTSGSTRSAGPMGGGIGSSPEDPSGGTQNQAMFVVRWDSSLTVRQAIARSAVLRGAPEEKADQLLSQQPEAYIISVMGNDMSPFAKTDEMSLKQKAYLQVKKTKQKLSPDRVEIRRRPNSQQIVDVAFYFARKSASGEAVIPADERQLEFVCETEVTKVKTNFDLSKMAISKGSADI